MLKYTADNHESIKGKNKKLKLKTSQNKHAILQINYHLLLNLGINVTCKLHHFQWEIPSFCCMMLKKIQIIFFFPQNKNFLSI